MATNETPPATSSNESGPKASVPAKAANATPRVFKPRTLPAELANELRRTRPFDVEKYLKCFPELSKAAKEYIRRTVQAPSRHPTGTMSVTTRYLGRKTHRVHVTESDEGELPLYAMGDYLPEILGVFDQTGTLAIQFESKGRTITTSYTPDALILWETGPELVEAKPSVYFVEQSAKYPNRYVVGRDGRFSSPPAERAAAECGLPLRVMTEHNFNGKLLQNIDFLASYSNPDNYSHFTKEELGSVLQLVARDEGIAWSDIPAASEAARSNILYHLLSRNAIFADLEGIDIRKTAHVRLFSSPLFQHAFALFKGKNASSIPRESYNLASLAPGDFLNLGRKRFEIIRVAPGSIQVKLGTSGDQVSYTLEQLCAANASFTIKDPERIAFDDLIGSLNSRDLRELLRRYHMIVPYLPGGAHAGESPKKRTVRRYLEAFKKLESLGIPGARALVPRTSERGFRGPHGDERVPEILNQIIEQLLREKGAVRANGIHGILVERCKDAGIPEKAILSLRSVQRALAKRSKYDRALAEGGPRVAMRFKAPYSGRSLWGAKNGKAPFDVAHIDHTPVDAVLLRHHGDSATARAWVSKMADGFSGKILAYVLWFGAPNTWVVLQLLQDCVRRHGTLPRKIVCDWGTEFRSTAVQTACASIGVTLRYRPKGKPRFGGPVESSFNSQNQSFVVYLDGNLVLTRTGRTAVGDHAPQRRASWTEAAFAAAFEDYVAMENRRPSATDPSPDDICTMHFAKFGTLPMKWLPASVFERLKRLPVDKNTRVVSKSCSIRVRSVDYADEILRDSIGKDIPVFTDDNDPRRIFVELPGHLSQVEIGAVTAEVKDAGPAEAACEVVKRRMEGSYQRRLKRQEITGAFAADLHKKQAVQRKQRKSAKAQRVLVANSAPKANTQNSDTDAPLSSAEIAAIQAEKTLGA